MLMDTPGVIGSGGHGGFQAINLALQFGASRVLLTGIELNGKNGLHWHQDHDRSKGLNNPKESSLPIWAERLDGEADKIAALGVTIVDCSTASALKAYPKMTIAEALRHDA